MIRLTLTFGVLASAVVAVGNMPAEQLRAIGQALLALVLAYWLTVLPWLLAALFAWRYWRWKRTALGWISFGRAQMAFSERQRDLEWQAHQEAARRTIARSTNRKRATR